MRHTDTRGGNHQVDDDDDDDNDDDDEHEEEEEEEEEEGGDGAGPMGPMSPELLAWPTRRAPWSKESWRANEKTVRTTMIQIQSYGVGCCEGPGQGSG